MRTGGNLLLEANHKLLLLQFVLGSWCPTSFCTSSAAGGGRRAVGKSRQPKQRGSRARTHRGTQDARPGGSQRILARLSVPLAKAPKRTQVFPKVEKEDRSGRGERSRESVVTVAEKFGHCRNRNEAPSHRRLELSASRAPTPPCTPAGPTQRGGTRMGRVTYSPTHR